MLAPRDPDHVVRFDRPTGALAIGGNAFRRTAPAQPLGSSVAMPGDGYLERLVDDPSSIVGPPAAVEA